MSTMNEKGTSTPVLTTTETVAESSDTDRSDSEKITPQNWPSQAEHLALSPSRQWPLIIFDVILILIPVALICKIVLCIYAAHVDRNSQGLMIGQVHQITIYLVRFNAQLTTLFTIVFVTILSTLVRRIALWRAQKGASVAELEQWQASISLPSTLKAIWSLRMFTTTSAALVVVWSWYYLGSQASVREYKYRDSGDSIKINVTITNAQGPSVFDDVYFKNWTNSQKASTNAQFITALSAPVNLDGYDQNGLMLIPYVSEVESQDPDRHGYLKVLKPDQASYVSFVGVQVYTVLPGYSPLWTSRIVGNLHMETSYSYVECTPSATRNVSDFPVGVLDSMAVSINSTTTMLLSSNVSQQTGPATFDLWYRLNSSTLDVQAVSTTCRITTVPLEIKVECNAYGCIAKKLKSVAISDSASYQTVFSDGKFATRFFNELLLSTGVPSNRDDLTLIEQSPFYFVYFEDTKLVNGSHFITDVDILNALLPENIEAAATAHGMSIPELQQYFEEALEQQTKDRARLYFTPMLNSYQSIHQQAQAAITLETASVNPDPHASIFNGVITSPWLSPAQLHGTNWNPQYSLSIPWIILDFVSCAILLLAGIASVYLRSRILAPDIFGFVSSLTRDNPHIPLPGTASTLDGFARAKLLKGIKVQLADVEVGDDTGRVSLVQFGNTGVGRVTKLSKIRSYV